MHSLPHRTSRFTTALAAAMAVAFTLVFAVGCAKNAPTTVDRDAPLATVAERDQFRELLLKALDGEALYTLVGGLKPMSTGFWQGKIDVAAPDTAEIVCVRRALAPLRNQTYYADVQIFATSHDGKRHVEAYVVHREALAALIKREATFWSPLGISACTHPAEIVAIVDRLSRTDRWRAYGLLFGYPNYAVDFFVQAGIAADEREAVRKARGEQLDSQDVGPGKDREFYHIPTFASPTGSFTWAVPLEHVERDEDRVIAREAGVILATYREVRPALADASDPVGTMRANCHRDNNPSATHPHAPCPAAPAGAARALWGVLATGPHADRRVWCVVAGDELRWTHLHLDLNSDGRFDPATESFAGVVEPGSTRVVFRPPASALGSEHTLLPVVVEETGTIAVSMRWRNRAEMSGCWTEGPVGSTPQFAPTPTGAPLIHFDLTEPLDILRYDVWPKAVAGEKFDVNTVIGRRGQGRSSFVAASLEDVLPPGAGLEAELRYADRSGRSHRVAFPVMQRSCSKILFEWIVIPADAAPGVATIRLRGRDGGILGRGPQIREQTFAIEIDEPPSGNAEQGPVLPEPQLQRTAPRRAPLHGAETADDLPSPTKRAAEVNRRLESSHDQSTGDPYERLAGVWSVEHVEVFAKEGLSSLSPDQAAAIAQTWASTDRTNALLREQRLTILHTLYADGTYTHTLDWVDAPERRVEESGTWTIDSSGVIRCVNSTGEASSLPEAHVLSMDDSSLIVRMDFSGRSAGQAEIVRHRRLTGKQDAPITLPPTPSAPSQK